jgi:hypothetical protein
MDVIGRELRENVCDWLKNCSVETIYGDHGFYMECLEINRYRNYM